MNALFAYGTLLFPEILRAVTGRTTTSSPATLDGFVRRRLIGEIFPAIVEGADRDRVDGVVYSRLDGRDWQRLDVFEGDLYERRSVTVRWGPSRIRSAFTYVLRDDWRHRLGVEPWDPEAFARDHLAAFAARIGRTREPRASE